MRYNAEEVQHVEFHNAPVGRRGYNKPEVDAFLNRIARTLSDEDDLTAAEVHHVTFGRPLIGKRGYDEREVDEFLNAVEDHLIKRTGVRPEAHEVPEAREASPEPSRPDVVRDPRHSNGPEHSRPAGG